MKLRFAPLFSGSSGNAMYVGAGRTHLLLDAGLSGAKIIRALKEIGVAPEALSGILITHEHGDHIAGAGVLSRRFDLPVYATGGTWREMEYRLGRVDVKNARVIEAGLPFCVGEVQIAPFALSHDAAEPVGYQFTLGGARLAVATDVGAVKESWIRRCEACDMVLLEANYDPGMLEAGPYPYELKRRILSARGHLSNEDAGQAAVRLAKSGVRHIVLGHLSQENNFPELAQRTVAAALSVAGLLERTALETARRDGLTGLYEITGSE